MVLAGTKQLFWALLQVILVCSAPPQADMPKALVVVGPVDPPANLRTNAYIAEAEQVACIIEHAGYRVIRLYHPYATWERLRRHALGADLLVYYGHGNGRGWLGYTDPAWVNGLCLTHPDDPNGVWAGKWVPGGNANDLALLGLGPDSTVALVHTCFAAGSSASDRRPADYRTATARVMSYAEAFFRAGAAHYVATTYVGVAPDYFRSWTSGDSSASAFLETMGGRRVHSEAGVTLAEERRGPRDSCPWVSACVSRPVQVARAPDSPTEQATGPPAQTFVTTVIADSRQSREHPERDVALSLGRHREPEPECARDHSDGDGEGQTLLEAWRQCRRGRDAISRPERPGLRDAWAAANAPTQAEDPHPLRYSLALGEPRTDRAVH